MLEDIIKAHQAGDLDAAEPRYRDWLASHPDDAEAHHLLATLRRQRDDVDDALALAAQAVNLDPDQASYHITLGGLHLRRRDLERGRDAFATALRLDPNHAGAALGLAEVAIAQRDFASARDALAKAERLAPDHPRVLAQKASLAQARGDHETAIKLFIESANADANDPAVHASLAISFMAMGRSAFAEQALGNALRLAPGHSAARVALGRLKLVDGRTDEALAEFEQVLRDDPHHPIALSSRGDLHRSRGDLASALDDYRHAHAQAPQTPGLAAMLIRALLASGADDEARQLLAASLADQPRNPDLRRLALTLAAKDGDERYRQAARAWLDADPDSLEAREDLASHLELRADHDQADALAREALARDGMAAFARLLLARSALRAGQPEQAQEQLNLLPENILTPAARSTRALLRGLTRDALDDHQGALEAWLASQALRPGTAALAPLPDPAAQASRDIIQAATAVAAPALGDGPNPVFLLALPGAGGESLAALLRQFGIRVLDHRFAQYLQGGPIAPEHFGELASRIHGEPELADEVRRMYADGLTVAGETPRADLVDWLPFPDLRIIATLRAAFPGSRFVLLDRDPRDCLLNWLAIGSRHHLTGTDPVAMGQWLARTNAHLDAARAIIPTDHLLTVDSAELADADALAARLLGFLGLGKRPRQATFDIRRGRAGLPTALPDGRWQAYAGVLADALAPLQTPG